METPTPTTPEQQLAAFEARIAEEEAANAGMPDAIHHAQAMADSELADAQEAYARAVDDARAARHETYGVMGEVRDAQNRLHRANQRPVRHPVTSTPTSAAVVEMDLAQLRQQIAAMGDKGQITVQ